MMTTYRLTLQYDGTRYDGWQRQGNTENTIQGRLEQVLSRLCGHRIEIHGAGRTDAGVHALAQIASFRADLSVSPDEIRDYCNRYLPGDIAVLSVEITDPRFHARLNARGKHYAYRLWVSPVPNVFARRYVTPWTGGALNIDAMRAAAALLTGRHDFRAFCSNRRMKKSTVRTIDAITLTANKNEIRFDFYGNGFLYNMVRILVGTLVEIGAGERTIESLETALTSGDRADAGKTMPAQGLTLCEVFYEAGAADADA